MVVPSTVNKLVLPLMLRRVADRFGGTDCQRGKTGSSLGGIPLLTLFSIFKWWIVKGIALSGTKG